VTTEPTSITLTSNLFDDGGFIPRSAAHGMAGGDNISPDLSWGELPPGTQSLAVTCYDPDAPTTVGFSHWILFNLSPDLTGLASGAGAQGQHPEGSVHGFSDFGERGYGGMAPPAEDPAHHYIFTVYALDVAKIELGPRVSYALFNFGIRGHVIGRGTLTGLFASS
jgi:Raf kinase inhibitor-like YbhB/YbcL family protein